MDELLAMFKLTIGDYTPDTALDDYYKNFLNMAAEQLKSNDISDETLETNLGQSAVVLWAEALMAKKDIANEPTLILLRNTLAAQTKGARYADGD